MMGWLGAALGFLVGKNCGGVLVGIVGAVVGFILEVCLRKLFFKEKKEQATEKANKRKKRVNTESDDIARINSLYAEARKDPNEEGRVGKYVEMWDIVCARGKLTKKIDGILKKYASTLKIPPVAYYLQRSCRVHPDAPEQKGGWFCSLPSGSLLEKAFRTLGASLNATDEDLKNNYHERVKRLHPDALAKQNLSSEDLQMANRQMVLINSAWQEIKRIRGI